MWSIASKYLSKSYHGKYCEGLISFIEFKVNGCSKDYQTICKRATKLFGEIIG